MARKKTITIVCYNEVKSYPESKRQELAEHFLEGMCACDGSERERYTNIYCDLMSGKKLCKDCDTIIF